MVADLLQNDVYGPRAASWRVVKLMLRARRGGISWSGHGYFSFDMSGHPTLTMPNGFTTNGLPLSFQFVGRQLDESLLVRAGYAYQQATDWHRRHPPV
jgi:Asp-tRNA(Asn)/Glu-tRNA(Gln) amidotransferase A subunit family amidase